MPELRQAPATKEWIIIASERAKRPGDFRTERKEQDAQEYVEDCPFCPGHEDEEYYLWHIRIIPRLTRFAGLELGSGMHINTARPEDTAAFLREAPPRR